MKVIVEYDAPDLGVIVPGSSEIVEPDEAQRRREVYVRAELRAPFGWTVTNVQIEP